MDKLIFALHGSDLAATLTSPAFRERLASAGASAVQVNLDDAAVAEAMRFGPGTPITALASVWSADASDPDAVTGVLGDIDPEVHGYRVTEKVRLDPAPVPDGQRSDVLAQVAILRRPETMTREEYLAYWMVQHTPIAIRTQNTSGYVQNIVEEALTPASPEISAIVEEHFPMTAMHDSHAFYGSRGDEDELKRRFNELMDSVARFGADTGLDLVPTSRYFWSL